MKVFAVLEFIKKYNINTDSLWIVADKEYGDARYTGVVCKWVYNDNKMIGYLASDISDIISMGCPNLSDFKNFITDNNIGGDTDIYISKNDRIRVIKSCRYNFGLKEFRCICSRSLWYL